MGKGRTGTIGTVGDIHPKPGVLPMGSGRLWSGSRRGSLWWFVYRFYCDFCLWWFVLTFLVTVFCSVFSLDQILRGGARGS